jgi:HSP20 family protein
MSKSDKPEQSKPISNQPRNSPFANFKHEFENVFKDFNSWLSTMHISNDQFEGKDISPSIDIIETSDSFKIEAEMPGIGEEDIKVEINGNMLTIKGEKSTSKKESKEGYIMREISYGNYTRSIALPDSVDTSQGDASFRKGMLWVSFPKKPHANVTAKEIPVKRV